MAGFKTVFQFLIGRLRTLLTGRPRAPSLTFQFLIGRLRTSNPITVDDLIVLFQFLIGRLRTPFEDEGADE